MRLRSRARHLETELRQALSDLGLDAIFQKSHAIIASIKSSVFRTGAPVFAKGRPSLAAAQVENSVTKRSGVLPHDVALDKVGGPLLNAVASGDFCNPYRRGVWHNRRSAKGAKQSDWVQSV